MSQGETTANPVCCEDRELAPPPEIGALVDPAEPHPGEPGAPDDAPTAVLLALEPTV
jgi:hypothetical protein